jgi:hypothetical protein
VGGQIRIADANNVQGTHERFEAYVLQAERLTLQFLGNRVSNLNHSIDCQIGK